MGNQDGSERDGPHKMAARSSSKRDSLWKLCDLGHRFAPISAEGECVSLDAWIEELDLECMVSNRTTLSDQLVKALPGHHTLPVGIDIGAVAVAGRRTVNGDTKPHRLA